MTPPTLVRVAGSIASGEEKGQKSGIPGFQAFVQKPDKGWTPQMKGKENENEMQRGQTEGQKPSREPGP